MRRTPLYNVLSNTNKILRHTFVEKTNEDMER
jgi:hypothetical protein